ncbi:zinc finger protein 595-like [Drosophila montana]|uniref:zinc finger protein 595-like n=1 Tax=Drosophila montana TaxID=40370 RepID=UPI00313AD346
MKMEAVCRICRSNCVTLVNIFDQLEQEPPLVDILNECGNCKISPTDPLPQNICLSCILDAQNAFQFKRRCEHSQQYFWLLLGVENKDISDCEDVGVQCTLDIKEEPFKDPESCSATNSDCEDLPLECTLHIKEEPLENIPQGSSPGNQTLECNAKSSEALQLGVEKKENSDIEKNATAQCTSEIKQEPLENILQESFKVYESSSAALLRQNSNEKVDAKKSGKPKFYSCLTCGKLFIAKRNLTTHKRIHTNAFNGQRPFKCRICQEKFLTVNHLKRHNFNHANERSYKCPHCLKTFAHRDNLNKHIRVHLEDHEHKCPHCQRLFRYAHILDEHIRTDKCTNSGYKCPLCLKMLYSEGYLRRHMSNHSRKQTIGEKVPKEMQTRIDNSEDRNPSPLSLVKS